MSTEITPRWLPEPAIEFFQGPDGRTESAYISLRKEKATHQVQPNPDHLVFFYIGADHYPVGVRLLEPVLGEAGAEVLMKLVFGRDGTPAGVDKQIRYFFRPMTLEQLDATLHLLQDANERLVAGSVA